MDDTENTQDSGGLLPEDVIAAQSPLAALGGKSDPTTDASPLTSKLMQRAGQYEPNQEDLETKRAGLLDAYQKLMEAQRYRGSAVSDPAAVAYSNEVLQASQNPGLMGQGKGLMAEMATRQGLQDKQAASEQNQANTGKEMAAANLGFTTGDQDKELDYYKQAALSNYRDTALQMRAQLAQLGKNELIKDSQGNPLAVFNHITGTLHKPDGSLMNGQSSTGPAPIPGLVGGSSNAINAGLSQIFKENDLDPNAVTNRTKAEIASSEKDSENDKNLLDASNNAAQIASRAKDAIDGGYQGGALGSVISAGSSMLPQSAQPQWVVNRDLLNKYSGQISSSLAAQMHNSRIGVGMEKFVKNTTFNPDIAKDANMSIVQNLQDMPNVAQQNLKLGTYINNLPEAHKNTVYSEFLKDNPPYIEQKNEDGSSKYSLNPAYKDPQMVRNWFAKRAAAGAGGQVKPSLGDVPPEALAEAQRRIAERASQ